MPVKVEKKDGLWRVDYGGGIEQDFRDWEHAIDAAHAVAALDRCGYVTADREDSLGRIVSRPG